MEGGQRRELQHLMASLADGERSAFHPVFETLWPILRTFCRRLLRAAEADDAAQAALLKIFGRAGDFDPRRDALTWSLGIAANECRTLRRKEQRRREVPDQMLDTVPNPQPSVEERAILADLHTALAETLEGLSETDRATIEAALIENRDACPELAPATFRKRLERAMSRLRSAWRAKHGAL